MTITAEEMRKIAKEHKDQANTEKLIHILTIIRREATQGRVTVDLTDQFIVDKVLDITYDLEQLGYQVGFDGACTRVIINW